MREFKINGVEIPIDIPDYHREMYAEWVKRGKPQMELQAKDGSWVCCCPEPGWDRYIPYRFKASKFDATNKVLRHLIDEMPIAKEFKAELTEHDASPPISALQTQVGGDHYAKLKIQPAQYCHANGIGHMAGDAISYISRYKYKNGKQDLLKAIHSLQLLIELEYGDEG